VAPGPALPDRRRDGPYDVGGGLDRGLEGPLHFGTGLHPTTRLCLLALADLVGPATELLDVGTGSGILAIGAGRLGARRVLGLDVDGAAVAIALANAERNGLALEAWHGPLDTLPAADFDLVAANLLAGLVVQLAPELARRTRPGGLLVASGILAEQADEVAAALVCAGFDEPERRQSGDWVALVARRRAAW
jgi:ribosomal protein L11 methyltransferase